MNRKSSKSIWLSIAVILLLVTRSTKADVSSQIRQLIDRLGDANQFSGSVLVASNDTPLFQVALGKADQELNVTNQVETRFRIASVTKGFTAVLILQAVERGELTLDSNLAFHIPEITNSAVGKITLRQLLSHTSGLTDFAPRPRANETVRDALMRQLELNDLKFEPGSQYEYCNVGFTILGTVLEKATGSSLASLLQNRIFIPAGLTATYLEDEAHRNQTRARGYSVDGVKPEEEPDLSIFLPAGGIVSTTRDLLLFGQALADNKLLPAAAQEGMLTPVKENSAYGCQVRTLPTGEKIQIFAGGMPGTSSLLVRMINGKYMIVILSNRSSIPVQQIAQQILRELTAADVH